MFDIRLQTKPLPNILKQLCMAVNIVSLSLPICEAVQKMQKILNMQLLMAQFASRFCRLQLVTRLQKIE